MIDFHLNENREVIMLHVKETKAFLVFSQSYPTLYLIREILSLPHNQLLSTSVWGINLTLYSIQRAIYNLKWKPFKTKKRGGGKKKHHYSWRSINLLPCKMFTVAFSTCFHKVEGRGETGFYLPIALPPVIPNGPGTEDVRQVNRRMKWALGWLSVD